eukprot:NODE_1676_length_796_cov_286.009371_g1303_i0.p1 GENE.NODE_1676_length_796_cov_286.009371_g1303_i0~~NODE_1676_length_796_cov_286.009371_g1303_i0.p1  ORF type:complete len:213 (+),score=38.03 NODE_1676_length_796_cov_286.009371_g1303_i0:55-693(+)
MNAVLFLSLLLTGVVAEMCDFTPATSGADDYLLCNDGSLCHWLVGDGFSCCNNRGGRKACPKNWPIMCSLKGRCASGTDYCCSNSCDSDADSKGPLGTNRDCDSRTPNFSPVVYKSAAATTCGIDANGCVDGNTALGSWNGCTWADISATNRLLWSSVGLSGDNWPVGNGINKNLQDMTYRRPVAWNWLTSGQQSTVNCLGLTQSDWNNIVS